MQTNLKSNASQAPESLRVVLSHTSVENVDHERRVLRGVSVITLGEALGHRLWIDSEFLDATVSFGNAKTQGAKSRFTHPGLSADGLGNSLGKFKNFKRDGDQVRADLHFLKAARNGPKGDLVSHLMVLAEEAPEDFGASIVFSRDFKAEEVFRVEHLKEDGETFESPDGENKRNFRHARMATLDAADMVGDPAANPNGLFSAGNEVPALAERIFEYAFGLTDEAPDETLLGFHPDRAKAFVTGFFARHGLELQSLAECPGDEEKTEDITTETEDEEMNFSELTVEVLRKERIDLLGKIEGAGASAGLKAGEEAERARALGILKLSREMGLSEFGEKLISEGKDIKDAELCLREERLNLTEKDDGGDLGADDDSAPKPKLKGEKALTGPAEAYQKAIAGGATRETLRDIMLSVG